MSTCKIPGCSRETTRWGTLCSTHKNHQRRHGHPLQRGITKTQLQPYIHIIQKWRDRNSGSPFWQTLEERWRRLQETAANQIAAYQSGRPSNKHQRQASQELLRVGEDAEICTIMDAILSMFVMRELAARSFLSDQAFWCQLARRVRALTDMNVGTWFDRNTGKLKRVYRDVPLRTSVILGQSLAETFGAAGLMLAQRETAEMQKQRDELQVMADAVEAFQ